jgi:NADH-quinone oxidoreductase subunit N
VLLFLCDALLPRARSSFFPLLISIVGLGLAAVVTWRISSASTPFFSGLVVSDGLAHFFRYIFFFTAAVSLYMAFGSKDIDPSSRMEVCILILCVTFGLSLMALSHNLLMLYIGIETVSILSFALAGFKREDIRSNEASIKYLVFGAFASGIMLYGFSLLYGYTGSLDYAGLAKFLRDQDGMPVLIQFALILVYCGLAYKISSFPMHFWTPDVYQGAPIPITTFFSVGPKAAGFAALLRFVLGVFALPSETGHWVIRTLPSATIWIAAVSAITMTVGNLSAIQQNSAKRILAYSSIAHVGYLLMGLVTFSNTGLSAVLFYLVVYCAMNMGAFWVVGIVSDATGSDRLESFQGIGWQMPTLGICMAIFLFSLTGLPFFAGFVGKFLLFGAVIQTPGLIWLALLGVLNSVVSLFYYTKILKSMWLDRPPTNLAAHSTLCLPLYDGIGLVGLAIPTMVFGLFFQPIVTFAEKALAAFMG